MEVLFRILKKTISDIRLLVKFIVSCSWVARSHGTVEFGGVEVIPSLTKFLDPPLL